MKKALALAALLALIATTAPAQSPTQCPTRPSGDNTNACASTAFVQSAITSSFVPANPTASVGLSAVNGAATTYMRSDSAPPLSGAVQSALTSTNHGVALGTGTFGFGATAAGTSGYALTGNGAADPTFQGFAQSGSGAITRTWLAKAQERVSVKDFGAAGDGTTSDVAAINATITAVAAQGGGVVWFPRTTTSYLIDSTITSSSNNVVFECESSSDGGVILKSSNLTTSVLVLSGNYNGVRNCAFQSAAQRTAGYNIELQGAYQFIEGSQLRQCYICVLVNISAGTAYINHFEMTFLTPAATSAGSGGIKVTKTASDLWISNGLIYSTASPAAFGINLVASGGSQLSHLDIHGNNNNLLINPGAGQTVFGTRIVSTYFDSSVLDNVVLTTTSTGKIQDTVMTNTWFNSNQATGTNGVLLNAASAANISGTNISNGSMEHVPGSTVGNGVYIQAATNTTISGLYISGWVNGILVEANQSQFTITNNAIGNYGIYGTPTTNTNGVVINAGTSDHYIITNNRMSGNSSAALTDGGTGTNKFINFNEGQSVTIPLSQLQQGSLVAAGPTRVKYQATGVNFNSANTDTTFTLNLPTGYTRYTIAAVRISHASQTLTTATFGLFTASGGGGTAILTGTAITVSTASENTNNNAQSTAPATAATQTYNASQLFFRVQTAQGAAATADVGFEIILLP